jgi:hypothetical protein
MADSTYLRQVIEPFIVEWVSRRIGVVMQSRRFPVGPRADGPHVHFEFDGVSHDGKIGLLVSAGLTVKTGARANFMWTPRICSARDSSAASWLLSVRM